MISPTFLDSLVRGEKNEGEIIAVMETDAPAVRGESNVTYREVIETSAQKAADTMSQGEIPTGSRNAVRDYFNAINPETRQN